MCVSWWAHHPPRYILWVYTNWVYSGVNPVFAGHPPASVFCASKIWRFLCSSVKAILVVYYTCMHRGTYVSCIPCEFAGRNFICIVLQIAWKLINKLWAKHKLANLSQLRITKPDLTSVNMIERSQSLITITGYWNETCEALRLLSGGEAKQHMLKILGLFWKFPLSIGFKFVFCLKWNSL